MNINELQTKISSLNSAIKSNNTNRQSLLGKAEVLKTQLNAALNDYKTKYGVELTPETISAEMNKIQTEKIAEVERIENILNLIQSGNYEEANRLVVGDNPTPVAEPTVESVATPTAVAEPTPVVPTPTPIVEPTPVAPAPQPIAPPPVAEIPTPQPIAPPPVVEAPTPQPTTEPAKVNTTGITGLGEFSEPNSLPPVAPPPVVQPTAPTKTATKDITSFGDILGGTAFQI